MLTVRIFRNIHRIIKTGTEKYMQNAYNFNMDKLLEEKNT